MACGDRKAKLASQCSDPHYNLNLGFGVILSYFGVIAGLYWGYVRLCWSYIGVILGYIGVILGFVGVILGLYWDNGKEDGSYCIVDPTPTRLRA